MESQESERELKMPADDSTWSADVMVVEDTKQLKQAVHDEMELIGCGFFQRRVVAILGFGNVADAVEILAIGYILTVYEDTEGKISAWESSFLTAAVFAGMLGGGFFGGILGDIYGRKPVLLVNLAINAVSAFLSAFSTSIYWLIFFRTLAGLGVGGVGSTLFALCLEHIPVSARGRYVTILCSFWMVGSILTAGTAWIMLGNDTNGNRILDISWRWFAGVVGLPSLICFLFTSWYIPESPHFLASQGKIQSVNEVIQFIHDTNDSPRRLELKFAEHEKEDGLSKPKPGKTPSAAPTTVPASSRGNVARAVFDADRMKGITRLFHQPYMVGTVLLMLCSYCLSFGSYGLSTWITKLFQSVGLHNPFANAFIYAGANLPGNLASIYLVDMVGRKQLLSGTFFASATCALLFAFEVEGSATVIVLVSCLFNACTTTAWNAFGVLSAETFPLEVRTTGLSLVNCSNRIGAICAQFVNGFLMGEKPHVVALLLVVSSVMVTGGTLARAVKNPEESDLLQRRASIQEGRKRSKDDDKQLELTSRSSTQTALSSEYGDDDGDLADEEEGLWSETQRLRPVHVDRSNDKAHLAMLWGDVELTLPCASPDTRERSSFSIAWASSSSETDSSGDGELLDGEGRRSPREDLRRHLHRTTLHADDAGSGPRKAKATRSTALTSSGASQSPPPRTNGSETTKQQKQQPFPDSMRTPVIDAAEHSTEVVRREALKAAHSHPSKLRNVRLLETKSGVSIYHYRRRRATKAARYDHQKEEPSLRVLAVTQLHSSLNEIVNLIGPKSKLSFPMLNPGVADYKTLCVLIDEPAHYVAVKSMAMDSQWQSPHTTRLRTFTVIESQQAFQTDDGRRGWAVSFHSLYWSSCLQPPLGAVRGSVYNTGLVALETEKNSQLVDLFTVAEFNLKGQASARVNFLAARDRVFDTLLLLNGTLEQRAANELSLLHTTDFNEIQRLTTPAEACSQCSQLGASPMHRCRKCCVAVCGGCSTMLRRGKKEMRLCFDCWAETTLQF